MNLCCLCWALQLGYVVWLSIACLKWLSIAFQLSDFLLHVKRWMLKFELTLKCTHIQPLCLNMDCGFPGGGVYAHFRVGDVTNPEGMSCNPYQLFVVVIFFKSKYLPFLSTLSVAYNLPLKIALSINFIITFSILASRIA